MLLNIYINVYHKTMLFVLSYIFFNISDVIVMNTLTVRINDMKTPLITTCWLAAVSLT